MLLVTNSSFGAAALGNALASRLHAALQLGHPKAGNSDLLPLKATTTTGTKVNATADATPARQDGSEESELAAPPPLSLLEGISPGSLSQQRHEIMATWALNGYALKCLPSPQPVVTIPPRHMHRLNAIWSSMAFSPINRITMANKYVDCLPSTNTMDGIKD